MCVILSFTSIYSFSQVTKRSKVCGYYDSYQLTVSNPDVTDLIVTRAAVTQEVSDLVWSFTIDGSWNSNGAVVIPNDGGIYWFIPFDPAKDPVQCANGSIIEITCTCSGTGICDIVTTSNGKGCSNNTCNQCCDEAVAAPVIAFGGGVFVKGETVTLNGVLFD